MSTDSGRSESLRELLKAEFVMLEEVAGLLVKLLKVIEVVVLRGVGNGQEVVSSKNFKTKIFELYPIWEWVKTSLLSTYS